jgi:hypothetical protein
VWWAFSFVVRVQRVVNCVVWPWQYGAPRGAKSGVLIGAEGSWEAGVDKAKPGIVMLDQPKLKQRYMQEHAKKLAADQAQVISLSESVTVPFGPFTNCLETKEWSRLERGVVEHKFYASGIGEVLTIDENDVRSELVDFTSP